MNIFDANDDFIGFKIKLYPDKSQEKEFKNYFGASRFIYNLGIELEDKKMNDFNHGLDKNSFITYTGFSNILTELKKRDEYAWLNNFDVYTLRTILRDLTKAYKRFFNKTARKPIFKRKKFHHQSFPIRPDRLTIEENMVKIPGIDSKIRCDMHGYSELIGTGRLKKRRKSLNYVHFYNSRIIFNGCDYFLTVSLKKSHEDCIEPRSCRRFINNDIWNYKKESEPVGIDLGCKKKNWIVDSNGNRIHKPDTSKEEKRIKKYHRKFNHKYTVNNLKGKRENSTLVDDTKRSEIEYTKNEEKILKKLNKAYKRVINKKLAIIHDYACSIIQEKPKSIIMEDLEVRDMLYSKSKDISFRQRKTHNRIISESLLYTIRKIIQQKAINNNIPFILADREFPSSQLCSCCGYRQKIGIKSIYKCPACGLSIDRDENAAYNLANISRKEFNQYNYITA